MLAREPSGGFGKEEDAEAEEEGEEYAEANDDAPGGVGGFNVADAKVDQVGYPAC